MNPNPTAAYSRPLFRAWLISLSVFLPLSCTQIVSAQTTYDWTGATSATWATASNYSVGGSTSSVVPGGADVVRFNSASYTNQPNLANAATVGELLFDASNTGGTSFGTGSNTLTINGVGGYGVQLNAGTGAVNINFNLTLKLGASQTWLNNSANGFTSNQGISLNTFALTVDGSGTTTFGAAVSGSGSSITKTGSGLLILSGANTYTGGTTISAGTLRITNAAALGNSSGAVSVASGATLDLRSQTVTNTNALTINGTGVSFGGALANAGSLAASYAGLVTLGSDSSIIASGNSLTLGNTGTMTGSGFNLTVGGASNTTIASIIGTGSGSLIKQDTGTLTLSGANTYTGATKITGGTLNLTGSLNSGSALEFGGGTLIYAPTAGGSTQTFNGTTVKAGGATITNSTSGNTVVLGVLTRNAGGLLNVSSLTGATTTSTAVDSTGILGAWATTGTGTSLTYAAGGSGGAITAYAGGTAAATAAGVTSTAGTVNYNVAAAGTVGTGASVNTLRYTGAAGTITGNFMTNGLMNAGTGTVTYSGNLTIGTNQELVIVGNTQATVISGGIADNAGGASGLTYGGPSAGRLTLSGAHTFTGAIVVNAGTLDLWSTSSYANDINLASASATLDAANTGNGTVTTISGNITGLGKINKTSSASTLVLAGNGDFTGGTTLSAGAIIVGNGTNNGVGTGTLTLSSGSFLSSDNSSRTFANTLSFGSNTLVLGAAQSASTGMGDLNFTWAGSTSIGGSKTWTVNNATTVTFNNSWSGNSGWNVTKAGTGALVFNGNLTAGVGVVVSAGKLVLNGITNSYTGATTVNGGTLLVNGSITASAVTVNSGGRIGGTGSVGAVTFNTGAGLAYDIASASQSTGLTATGFSGTGIGSFTIYLTGAATGFNDAQNYSWVVLSSNSTDIGSVVLTGITLDTSGFGPAFTGAFNLTKDADSIYVNYAAIAVPEPATYTLIASVGLLGFACWRRRRV